MDVLRTIEEFKFVLMTQLEQFEILEDDPPENTRKIDLVSLLELPP